MTSNLVLRVNSLFETLKKRINNKKIFYIEADYIWGRLKKTLRMEIKFKRIFLNFGSGDPYDRSCLLVDWP